VAPVTPVAPVVPDPPVLSKLSIKSMIESVILESVFFFIYKLVSSALPVIEFVKAQAPIPIFLVLTFGAPSLPNSSESSSSTVV
jgi:hypothetical protein